MGSKRSSRQGKRECRGTGWQKKYKMHTKAAGYLRKSLVLLFWLLVWQIISEAVDNRILLASPTETFGELRILLGTPDFYLAVGRTLLRIGTGFVCGFLAAVVLAAGSYRYPLLGEVFSPLISLFKTVPVASFVVLLLIWWGSSLLAVSISFLVVLPGIYLNTLEGLRSTDRKLLEMAQVFGLSERTCFLYIYRPSLEPFLCSGMKLALGMCWKAGVAAEVIGVPRFSIGEQLYLSKIYLDTAGVFAQTAVIVLLSVLLERLVLWSVGRFFSWEPKRCQGCIEKRYEGDVGTVPGAEIPDLVISHIEKSYEDRQILQDLNQICRSGKTYWLTSPSGSGKTTLFRILCGLEKPDAGEVGRGIRYSVMFQEDRLCEDYSALRNVELVTGDRERAARAMERLLGADVLQKPVRTLSGGMKRRVALARAMEAVSHVVLLDEPFTGLDETAREQVEQYIRERQAGRTLLIASHIRHPVPGGEAIKW